MYMRKLAIRNIAATLAGIYLAVGTTTSFASPLDRVLTVEDFKEKKVYSPYVGRDYPDQVLFCDTQCYTNRAGDA